MKIICGPIIRPTVAKTLVFLLLLEFCIAYPMDKIVVAEDNSADAADMEVAESEKAPVLVFPVKNSEYYVDGFTDNIEPEDADSNHNSEDKIENQAQHKEGDTNDTTAAESSHKEVVVSAERKGRNLNQDTEAAESANSPLESDDYNLHSQAEENDGQSGFRISLFKPPVKSRESVNLESEAPPSKILSFYDNSQKIIADKTQPLPILDTISEDEKYGNNGDMFDGISRSLVNGYEAFSNFLNSIIQKPREIFKSLNKSVNAQLDMIGGKLVGL